MRLEAGTQIGEYTIGKRIGIGARSIVYEATNANGQPIAFKLLARALTFNAQARIEFQREVEQMVTLRHPNIVDIYAFGQHRQQVYMARELMANSLAPQLDRTWSLPEVSSLVFALAPALEAAHSAEIIHGNLKPANILFSAENTPHISDFGLGQKAFAGSGLSRQNALGDTTYLSPEQLRSEPLTGGCDIYALGLLIYRLLLGKMPFDATTPAEMAQQHLTAAVPQTGNELDVVWQRSLAKDSAERFQTPTELAHAIPAKITKSKTTWWQRVTRSQR